MCPLPDMSTKIKSQRVQEKSFQVMVSLLECVVESKKNKSSQIWSRRDTNLTTACPQCASLLDFRTVSH